MRRQLRRVHAYVGLALSLLLFCFAVTGGALVYKEAYWRLVYPELRAPAPQFGPADHAAAIAAAWSHFGGEIQSIKLPEPGLHAYHVYLDDGEAFLSAAADHGVIDRWRSDERVMAFLFDLHAHLMAGETGERVGGVIALLGVVLATTGLVLWWPARRRFASTNLLPRDLSRRGLILWHRDLGALASPVLLVLLLTGSGLVFYNTARAVLNGVLGDAVPSAAPPVGESGTPFALPDAAMISRAESAFPDGRIVFYYPPEGDGIQKFRLKQPCELHPNGRSYLYLDFTGRVIQKIDACTMPSGERAVQAFYPLHAGKAGSSIYKLVVFLGALALAALSLSGASAYLRKLRRS